MRNVFPEIWTIKAALVDLDGTLVDTHAANLAAYRRAIEDAGAAWNSGELELSVGKLAWQPMLARVMPGNPELHRSVAERKRAIYPEHFDGVLVNHALVRTLVEIHRFARTALVTSASRDSALPLLKAKNLADIFDLVVCSDDVSKQKPDPEAYFTAARGLGVAPAECVVFEDSEVGMAAAKQFGAQVWQVHWLGEGQGRRR